MFFQKGTPSVPKKSIVAARLGCRAFWCCGTAPDSWPMVERALYAEVEDLQGVLLLDAERTYRAAIRTGKVESDTRVRVLVPEAMAELGHCKWDGDGHYDIPPDGPVGPPTLGQIITFVRMVAAGPPDGKMLTVVLSPEELPAIGAVLAGAVLVLARGYNAENAWTEVLRACPDPGENPETAWDTFPEPYPVGGTAKRASSLRVIDCLLGLELARDKGWLQDYRSFDLASWSLLRRKFDATWLIPGEVLALGDPLETAQNPKYPGLLDVEQDQISTHEVQDDFVMSLMRKASSVKRNSVLAHGRSISMRFAKDAVQELRYDWTSAIDEVRFKKPISVPSTPLSFKKRPRTAPRSACEKNPCSTFPRALQRGSRSRSTTKASIAVAESKVGWWVNLTKPLAAPEGMEVELLERDNFRSFFARSCIQQIVRLNRQEECGRDESSANTCARVISPSALVKVYDFEDGEVPPDSTLEMFLEDAEQLLQSSREAKSSTGGTCCMAVHCKAGLGRTSVMIGAYAARCHQVHPRDDTILMAHGKWTCFSRLGKTLSAWLCTNYETGGVFEKPSLST
eukprot:TRINITY_DN20658_c0_g1_i3.p1 TRINITY_DN20658_c0_g1~~TRINITY_DN20658_c0_g1_i3.p1  ORF type:complete len:569 (-),score=95.44 TRINITY_DN20658_c0_g1_i3:223-1929(-)